MSDVVIKYDDTYNGRHTFVPDPTNQVDEIWSLDRGKRTLEFDLPDGQALEIELPTAKMRLLVMRDGFIMAQLESQNEVSNLQL